MTSPDVESGWIGQWSPGIGDPNVAGWMTVVLYVGAATACLVVARRLRPEARTGVIPRREFWAWSLFSVLLWLLAVNKQLDFQTALTEIGRMMARRQGWYWHRAHVQKLFIGALCGFGLLCVIASWIALRGLGLSVKVAALGMCFIGVFVLVRASSFHRVDAFLGHRLVHLRMNWLLEMGGIVIMLGAALLRVRSATGQNTENRGMTTRPAI
jgi:hypothetical protein